MARNGRSHLLAPGDPHSSGGEEASSSSHVSNADVRTHKMVTRSRKRQKKVAAARRALVYARAVRDKWYAEGRDAKERIARAKEHLRARQDEAAKIHLRLEESYKQIVDARAWFDKRGIPPPPPLSGNDDDVFSDLELDYSSASDDDELDSSEFFAYDSSSVATVKLPC